MESVSFEIAIRPFFGQCLKSNALAVLANAVALRVCLRGCLSPAEFIERLFHCSEAQRLPDFKQENQQDRRTHSLEEHEANKHLGVRPSLVVAHVIMKGVTNIEKYRDLKEAK